MKIIATEVRNLTRSTNVRFTCGRVNISLPQKIIRNIGKNHSGSMRFVDFKGSFDRLLITLHTLLRYIDRNYIGGAQTFFCFYGIASFHDRSPPSPWPCFKLYLPELDRVALPDDGNMLMITIVYLVEITFK